ncbi:chalcone isomerase family protein [Polynucleobacter sp. HIN7]|nr:chalcone isomerase family protein [Polynucleobacter sp. HIN7]
MLGGMKWSLYPTLCLALALLGPSWVFANASSTKSPVYRYIESASLQGQGRLTFWGFDVYDARYYVADPKGQNGFALEIHYIRSFKGADLAKRTIDEMTRLGVSEKQRTIWLQSLEKLFPDIASGDTLVGIHLPDRGTLFLHNGKPIGDIPGDAFAKAFFGIWLDERTSVPKLRSALIATRCPPALIAANCPNP